MIRLQHIWADFMSTRDISLEGLVPSCNHFCSNLQPADWARIPHMFARTSELANGTCSLYLYLYMKFMPCIPESRSRALHHRDDEDIVALASDSAFSPMSRPPGGFRSRGRDRRNPSSRMQIRRSRLIILFFVFYLFLFYLFILVLPSFFSIGLPHRLSMRGWGRKSPNRWVVVVAVKHPPLAPPFLHSVSRNE